MQLYADPFVHFIVGCFLIPPIWDKMGFNQVVSFYFHWSMVATAIALFLTVKVVHATKPKRAASGEDACGCEAWTARWYLLNGWVIHILLDGMVGVLGAHPVYADHYNQLDKRYGAPLGSAKGAYVHTISSLELFVYGPMCVYLYYAIHHKKHCRDAVEIVTCVAQLFGTCVYLLPEIWEGFPSMSVDYKFEFTLLLLKDFWFAVVLGNIIYFTIPTYLLIKACGRVRANAIAVAPAAPAAEDELAELVKASSASRGRSASKKKVEEKEVEPETHKLSRASTTGSSKRASSSRKKK